MKRIKKTLKGKGKIVAALAVVISFAAVLVWHQMQNASAHNQESPGFSRTYTNGYGRFYVDGPGNKSSWLEVKFYCRGLGKNVTQGTFNNKVEMLHSVKIKEAVVIMISILHHGLLQRIKIIMEDTRH